MSSLPRSVEWVWALSVTAQMAVLALLWLKGNFRRLPLFTTYAALNLCQQGFLALLYYGFGASSRSFYYLAWLSEAVTLLAQALAATEVLRLVLKPYAGIWGLGWRTLGFVSTVALAYVAVGTSRNLSLALLEADRGYHLIFGTGVIACLLLVRYYSVPLPSSYKGLLRGFCLFSCAVILINTISQALLYRKIAYLGSIWQFTSILSFALVQVIWAVALRKPLPAMEPRMSMATGYAYYRVSPEINLRLRELNERLLRLWRPEARPQ